MITFIILDITKSGGTERSLINTCNLLSDRGYNLTILSVYKSSEESFYKIHSKVRVIYLNMEAIPLRFTRKIKWFYSLYLKINKYAKVNHISHLFGTSHNISVFLPLIHNVKFKYACEHMDYQKISRLSRFIMWLSYRFLSGIIVLSETAKFKMSQLHKSIYVIPNSLSFKPCKKTSFNQKRFLMVGRISPEKGFDRLLNIAVLLKNEYPDWRIEIFGGGDSIRVQKLQYLISSYKLEDYVILNSPIKDINKEYINSSIYLMTSYSEAFPMVLLEAMACGLPVVAYRNEGTEEIIVHKKNGFLINNGDVGSFLSAVSQLISNKKVLRSMSRDAYEFSKKYDSSVIAEKWIKLIYSTDEYITNK